MTDYYYRFREVLYSSGSDEYGDPLPGVGRTEIVMDQIPVIKYTKCGAWVGWVGWGESDKKFVNLSWSKQYACPTIAEAQQSYLARKKRQIGILKGQLSYAEHALKLATAAFEKSPGIWDTPPQVDYLDLFPWGGGVVDEPELKA